MSEVTAILSALDRGEPTDTDRLLPLVYAELRRIAASKLSRESPNLTLQTTALVHEAYLRLTGKPSSDPAESDQPQWQSRGHFFGAAAEAMRRILIDHARRKLQLKRGGDRYRVEFENVDLATTERSVDLLALDEALEKLNEHDPQKAEIVKLRYFAGLTIPQTAKALQVSEPTIKRHWYYARAWLQREISCGDENESE